MSELTLPVGSPNLTPEYLTRIGQFVDEAVTDLNPNLIVFADRSARNLRLPYFAMRSDDNRGIPVGFISPSGCITKQSAEVYRSRLQRQQKYDHKYCEESGALLSDERLWEEAELSEEISRLYRLQTGLWPTAEQSVLLVDTCFHSGRCLEPVKNAYRAAGVGAVAIAAVYFSPIADGQEAEPDYFLFSGSGISGNEDFHHSVSQPDIHVTSCRIGKLHTVRSETCEYQAASRYRECIKRALEFSGDNGTVTLSPDRALRNQRDLQDINRITNFAAERGWRLIVTGGYSSDAWVGTITRPHSDIDLELVVEPGVDRRRVLDEIHQFLNTTELWYEDVQAKEGWAIFREANKPVPPNDDRRLKTDDFGRQIDVHVICGNIDEEDVLEVISNQGAEGGYRVTLQERELGLDNVRARFLTYPPEKIIADNIRKFSHFEMLYGKAFTESRSIDLQRLFVRVRDPGLTMKMLVGYYGSEVVAIDAIEGFKRASPGLTPYVEYCLGN